MSASRRIVLFVVLASGAYLLNRLGRRWGAIDAEYYRSLPRDTIIPHPMVETTHAVTINASAAEVWPWLVQMGYYRAGWYMDPAIWDKAIVMVLSRMMTPEERAAYMPRTEPSADRIIPEFQSLAPGDTIADGPPGTAYFTVGALEPNRVLGLFSKTHLWYYVPPALRNNKRLGIYGELSWTFVLNEVDPRTTRLILRTRANTGPPILRAMLSLVLVPTDFFNARRLLTHIKRRVAKAAGAVASAQAGDFNQPERALQGAGV